MAYTPKPKTLLYKRANFLGPLPAKATLQTLLAAALQQHGEPAQRHEQPDPNDPEFRLLNYTGNKGRKAGGGTMLACEFLSFAKEGNVGTIAVSNGVGHYVVDAMAPPEGKEFLGGSVYFGVLDDHVVILQSKPLRTKDLERHLNWFLRNRANVLAENNRVSLDDNLPADAGSFEDATGIEFAAPVQFQPVGQDKPLSAEEVKALKDARRKKGKKEERAETESLRVVPVGRAWDAVKAFLGEGLDLPTHVNAEEMLKSGAMKAKLALSWSNPRGEDATEFAQRVAHQFRHVTDEVEYGVRTKSGLIGKEKFKPELDCQIRWSKVQPDFDDVFPKMLEWLEKLFQKGIIKA
jgi:hypothetical protein